MAKDQSSKSSACSPCKIRRATVGTINHISQGLKKNVPNTPSTTDSPPIAKSKISYTKPISHRPPMSQEIPVQFNPQPETKSNGSVQKVVHFSSNIPIRDGEESRDTPGQKSSDDDNKFGSYIDRVRNKMRATSNVGGGKSLHRHDTFHDRVTRYIDRAKVKLRTTSSIGGAGKSASFK